MVASLMLVSSGVYKGLTMSQAECVVLLDAEENKEKCKLYLPQRDYSLVNERQEQERQVA